MRVDLSRTDWAARIAAGESLLPAALPLHRVQAELPFPIGTQAVRNDHS